MGIEQQRQLFPGDSNARLAFDGAMPHAQLSLAIKIQENRIAVAGIMGLKDDALLTPEVITKMSGEYLEHGTLSVNKPDGTIETKTHAELMKIGGPIAKAVGIDLENELPEAETLRLPAQRYAEAVQEHDGILSMIATFIQGLIKWVSEGGFKDGFSGLMDKVHEVGASKIADSAAQKIAADMQENASLNKALGGKEGLVKIRDQLYQATKDVADDKASVEINSASITAQVASVTPNSAEALKGMVSSVKDEPAVAAPSFDEIAVEPKVASEQDAANTAPKDKVTEPSRAVLMTGKFADASENKNPVAIQVNYQRDEYNTVANLAVGQVNQVFDLDKNESFWDKVATEASKNNRFVTYPAFAVKNKIEDAVGGSKGKSNIATAITMGAKNAMNNMTPEQQADMANGKQPKDFADSIAEQTFKTAEWKQVEKNIQDSSLEQTKENPQKTQVLAAIKDKVRSEITIMVKDGAPLQTVLIDVMQRAQVAVAGTEKTAPEKEKVVTTDKTPNPADQAMIQADALRGKFNLSNVDMQMPESFSPSATQVLGADRSIV